MGSREHQSKIYRSLNWDKTLSRRLDTTDHVMDFGYRNQESKEDCDTWLALDGFLFFLLRIILDIILVYKLNICV